jgi:hypothetical protein
VETSPKLHAMMCWKLRTGKKEAETLLNVARDGLLTRLCRRQIKGVRATVAAEALSALRLVLRDASADPAISEIRGALEGAVTDEQMYEIIELGNSAESIITSSSEKNISLDNGAFWSMDDPFALPQEVKAMW